MLLTFIQIAYSGAEDGPVGGTAQKVGGPFDKHGAVGKQFTEGGAVGGTAQSAAETAQGEKPSAFDAQGMIGKQFTSQSFIFISQFNANLLFCSRGRDRRHSSGHWWSI